MKPEEIRISDFDYALSHDKIAEEPLSQRDASKLLVYRDGLITDDHFYNLPQQLPEGATIVLNNTRVIEARLHFQKPTGGMIEIFCLEPFEQSMEESLQQMNNARWVCLIGGASKWKPGQVLHKELEAEGQKFQLSATYVSKQTDGFVIEFSWERPGFAFADVLHIAGSIPLPPYIKREVRESDKERYQTVFSRYEGSVAAPTAALHFTPGTFADLKKKNISTAYITLHVGAGTFKPVKSETIAGHFMHAEPFTVSKKALLKILEANRIIVVGTTSLRTLESLYWLGIKEINGINRDALDLQQWEAYELAEKFSAVDYRESIQALLKRMNENGEEEIHCHTALIILPGYQFHLPDALVTNFHQPQSTLLLLVSAFIGPDWKKVYQHALENGYRFLSYGDSSLLWRRK